MHNKAKYIVFEERHIEEMVIFSSLLQHVNIAHRLRCEPVISAGFIEIIDNEPVCFGESISLDIKSRGEIDTNVAKRVLKM